MKFYLFISLIALSLVAKAEGEGNFAADKKMMLENMSKQIETMKSNMSCVESATDMPSIKKCHETAKAEREKMQAEKTKMQTERINENIKKLEEKKKNLELKK